jgi:hypothetical protein
MFGFFDNIINTTLDVAEGLCYGELPTRRQVVSLIDAGMTVYAISEITGYAEEVIEALADED